MTSMRQAFENYMRLYGNVVDVEPASVLDALLRGAFSAGVTHGLDIARLSPDQAMAALDKMKDELDAFWRKEPPQ